MVSSGIALIAANLLHWIFHERLREKFCAKRSISNQSVGFKGSMFKGSEVDLSINYLYGINGIGKNREAINLSEA